MKRYFVLFTALFCAVLLVGCGGKEFSGRDLDEIQAYLDSLPASVEELNKQDVFIVSFGGKESRENWEKFYQNVQEGVPDAIVFIWYTTEGDPIITYVDYDGTDFYAVVDTTRDIWGHGEFFGKSYSYLNTYEWEHNGKTRIEICLSDDAFTTKEEREKSARVRELGYLMVE